MVRQIAATVRCDLCGRGGPLTRPEDFRRVQGVDLCVWCLSPAVEPGGVLSSGSHDVTFGHDGWTCSCGASYSGPPAGVPAHVLAAVPSLPAATATAHTAGPWGRGLSIGGWTREDRDSLPVD